MNELKIVRKGMLSIMQESIKKYIFILGVFLAVLSPVFVSASSYTPNNNLFEGTYSNNLIDMAMNQIDQFTSKKYAIFQIDYDYYLVCSDQVVVNGNSLIFTNSTIIKATRTSTGGYNNYYDYSTYTESQTSVYLSYVVISNVQANRTISSTKFDDYKFNVNVVCLLMFLLSLGFAIFLLKGRSFL